jgi:hypothetical protein
MRIVNVLEIKYFILIVCLALVAGNQNKILCQNLIPNRSFEEMISPPSNRSTIGEFSFVKEWFSPSLGSPDLFSTSALNFNIIVPENLFGIQNPIEGINYAGIGVYFNDNIAGNPDNANEYIAVKLIDTLKSNVAYCFNIYISCATYCCSWSVKDFGFLVSKQNPISLPKYSNTYFISALPTWKNPEYLTNDTQWEQISAEFIADGGEEYITIGIFTDPLISDTIHTGIIPPGSPCSYFTTYYYLDMVSLECCDQRGCDEVGVKSPEASKITFNNLLASNETFEIKGARQESILQVFNMSGQLIHESNEMQWFSGNAAQGMYFFRLKEPNGAIQHGKIIVQ